MASIWNNKLPLPTLEQPVLHFKGRSHICPPQFSHRCETACRHRVAQNGGRRNKPSDDAAAPPHESDGAVVQGPAELFGRLPQQHEALSVGDDLRGVEGLRK